MERRDFLALCSVFVASPVLANTKLQKTPPQAEGPFYPVTTIPVRPDLIIESDEVEGESMNLVGRVVDTKGNPISDVRVEIWQCDGRGVYDHPRQPNVERFDKNFAGFGALQSDERGQVQFRTLFPVPYTGRPPHIHVKLWQNQRELLTTQLYLKGKTGNEWWGGSERDLLQMDVNKDGKGEWTTQFQFVV
ncbi:protocatechuate 3,4-dioxygenase [Vibrio maritimus]|uniref:dioxygenase family protein n=1 Tax=Vibrio maritimus TaxID=990268 RepID=UPI003736227F